MEWTLRRVASDRDLEAFIRLPYDLYRKDPLWAAPLMTEEKRTFRAETNPMLRHCETALFLLAGGGRPRGRISAFVDSLALEHWKRPVGLFGSFECPDDPAAAALLLGAARDWLARKGMSVMRGPWSFASQEWGAVVEGGGLPAKILSPYNPPWVPALLEGFGLRGAKDLLVYETELGGYKLPERFRDSADRVAARHHVTVRPLDMKRIREDVAALVSVANASTSRNWGYVPVTPEEADDMARSLKPFVDPGLVLFAERLGQTIGYCIALPDVNVVLRRMTGRLLPFGWLRLALGLRRIRQYRIWALGVVPEFQRRAVDVLFYVRLFDAFTKRKAERVEANYVLEDNMAMNNPIRKLGMRRVKTFRVYEMPVK